MITVDQELMIPMNMHTHFFNISKASADPRQAKWELLHDYLDHYGLRNMSPEEIYYKIAERIMIDENRAK
jgi:hypothetical protein